MDINKWGVPLAIVVAAALIGGSIYLSNTHNVKLGTPSKNGDNSQTVQNGNIRPITLQDHIRGNPTAYILIVEYSDTECPYCKSFQKTLIQIMSVYGKDGKVA